MTFVVGQALIGMINFVDGCRPNYNRLYLIVIN